jgi:hypothetical protein
MSSLTSSIFNEEFHISAAKVPVSPLDGKSGNLGQSKKLFLSEGHFGPKTIACCVWGTEIECVRTSGILLPLCLDG